MPGVPRTRQKWNNWGGSIRNPETPLRQAGRPEWCGEDAEAVTAMTGGTWTRRLLLREEPGFMRHAEDMPTPNRDFEAEPA